MFYKTAFFAVITLLACLAVYVNGKYVQQFFVCWNYHVNVIHVYAVLDTRLIMYFEGATSCCLHFTETSWSVLIKCHVCCMECLHIK